MANNYEHAHIQKTDSEVKPCLSAPFHNAECSPNPTCPPTCSLIFPVIIFCIEFFSLRRRIHRCASAGAAGSVFHSLASPAEQGQLACCSCQTRCAVGAGRTGLGCAHMCAHQSVDFKVACGPCSASRRDDVRPGIIESSWRSALTLMLFDSFMVTSHGARVAVLAFMFLVSRGGAQASQLRQLTSGS